MGDRWGLEGPPEEAYSRVTRDLSVVLGGMHPYADRLVADLGERYGARVTDPNAVERARLVDLPRLDRVLVLRPADPAASPLVLGWTPFPGIAVAMGHHLRAGVVPICGCDACDTELPDAVEELDRVVETVVNGFEEFVRRRLGRVELGYRAATSGSTTNYRRGDHGYDRLPARSETISWAPW